MTRLPATSRKFLLLLRATQTARVFFGAWAVPFPRSVPPGIWAHNLLARRAKADGTLDGGEAEDKEDVKAAKEKDDVEEATTQAKPSFDQVSRNKAVDEAASAQTADPVEDAQVVASARDEQLQKTAQEKEDKGFDEPTEQDTLSQKLLEMAVKTWDGAQKDLDGARADLDGARADLNGAREDRDFARQRLRQAGDEKERKEAREEFEKAEEEFEKAKEEFEKADKKFEKADKKFEKADKKFEKADKKFEKAKEEAKRAESKVQTAKEEAEKANEKLEKAKSTAPLQAKAALRVIKEEDLGPLSQARVPAAKVQDGQRLVGIDACVKACMGLIEKYINRSDDSVTNRVPPTCAARCARGGKTTFLQELGGKLAGAQYFPIFVSFNGESPVKRRDNELADAWLYRTIAYALLPGGTLRQDVAAKFGTVTCGELTLKSYFASQKNVVLLVDELNHLLLKSPNPADKEAERRASRFMKDVFLDADGAYMVFTSHIQSTGLDLTQYMEGNSVRGLEITGLPFAAELQELQNMSTAFSGLTHMKAAYYSRVPALLWSSQHDEFLLAQKFSQIEQDPQKHLAAFLREVLGGTPMREIEAFRQLTDGSQKERPIWITCFMSHFLIQCSTTCPSCGVLGRWLQGMQAAEEKDGKAWEKIIAVAFGLRYIWQQMGGEVHGWLHGHEGAAIECLDANPAAKTVEEAIQQLPQPLQPLQYPTLQLVLPSHAQFEAVDLFAVRREADSTDLVMVAQQKEGSASVNQPRPQTAQHAYWMRGSPTQKGKRKDGWILPSQSEIEQFLGPSLAAAAPATWRDPVD